MKIVCIKKNDTIEYAADELKKYVTEMSRGVIVPEIFYEETASKRFLPDTIILGTLDELDLDRSDLSDPFVEDIIDISVDNCSGYIAGSNPRSILMGVYKYCTSAGCRFIRPGADGDYVPHSDLYSHSYHYRKKADYPFRGQCCEGAISYEHMRDTVYWLPKVGMNTYMLEDIVPYTYMHKWYGHVGNSKLRQKGQLTDYEMLRQYISLLEQDIKKVGLQLHTLGHGWMFEKLGTRDLSSPRRPVVLTQEDKRHLALVKGKREINHDPFYTQFCYSNPETRKLLVDTLVEYIENKPHVDFVHVWLADAVNNQCECEACVKWHPSELFVMMLNELDAELTKRGLTNRIVFIMYTDTERPPVLTKLNNPGRFVLLSAIGLHYDKGYDTEVDDNVEIPPYVRNDYHPASPAVRMKWHKDWKKHCDDISSIIFEYRFYMDMYCDLGHMQLTRETYRDMTTLGKVPFEGSISDQTCRMHMPTALPMAMMGQATFDTSVDYDSVVNTYFDGAFGADSAQCREYLEKLSVLLSPSNYRIGGYSGVEEEGLGDIETQKKCWINNAEVAERAKLIPDHIRGFMPVIEKNISDATNPAQRKSWIYLYHHGRICTLFSAILLAGALNDMDLAKEKYNDLEGYLSEHEMEFHDAFDVFLYLRSVRMKLYLPNFNYFD